jgi:hypothetical protein
MIDYRPLTDRELKAMMVDRAGDSFMGRAVAEIRIRRAAADRSVYGVVVVGLVVIGAVLCVIAADSRRDTKPAAPIAVCSHATGQLSMARTLLARGRPGDVEDALMIVAAIAPTAGFCRDDDAVKHALERAARGGDRVRSLGLVDAVLRSER